ncbi:hypothetical protein KI387_003523, partial [Taxus chinensis]
MENAEKIMNRGGHWPVGDGHMTNIKEELRELNVKPTTSMEMESVKKSFNNKLNGKDNNLQQLYSNDNKPRDLDQTMIYSTPKKSILNWALDTDSKNLCSPKQENRGTISAACKLEGYGSECNSLERAAGQISMDAGHGPRREKKSKDQHNIFSSSHVILLENLEKDVTPSDVLGVIRQAGVDFVKVYISPPQSFEKFTSGIVCFEDQESYQKVSAYLGNENVIIASSKGRPWVVIDTENGLSSGSYGGFTMEAK